MSLLLSTAILFGLIGIVLTPSRDHELAQLGIVMLVTGFVFAAITYVVAVGP